jgi:hypothetical protein
MYFLGSGFLFEFIFDVVLRIYKSEGKAQVVPPRQDRKA